MPINTKVRVKHSGAKFEYGDEFLIVPDLTCVQAEELKDKINLGTSPMGLFTRDQILAMDTEAYASYTATVRTRRAAQMEVVAEALKRNYPEITEDEINEFCTVHSIQDQFNAALGLVMGEERTKNPVGENPPAGVT